MKINQLETPVLTLDLDILEENFRRMDQMLSGTNMRLRPHYKSHKCAWIARRQMENGAKGITCAKLGEAEDLAQAGIPDILIANQVVTPSKISRLAALAGKCRLSVCVDDIENIRNLGTEAALAGNTIHILIEYDIGMKRCGVRTKEEVLALALAVMEEKYLSLDGIQAYAGHLAHERNFDIRSSQSDLIEEDLRSLLAWLRENGIEIREVSGTSTGTAALRKKDSVYTEIQAGSYIFMDAAYAPLKPGFAHALHMQTTVVSTACGRVVVDAGIKSCGVDQGPPICVEYPAAEINLSEEHMDFAAENLPPVGSRLTLIPGHCCTTVNLHDKIYLVRGEDVVDCIPVTSRGKCI